MRHLCHGCDHRAQLAGALGGNHETDNYTLKMLKSDVGAHSIRIRAPKLGEVSLDGLWD